MTQRAGGGGGATAPPRTGIGEVLVEMGAISRADLEAALARQRTDGRRLGEILVAEGRITPARLADGLARRLGVPRADMRSARDPEIARLLDARAQRRYLAVPLGVEADGAVVMAMADPADVLALDDLRMMVGREVRPALATREEIEAHLDGGARRDFLSGVVAETAPAGVPELSLERDLAGDAGGAPVVRLVGSVISRAVEEGASDVHLEAQPGEMLVRMRVDGVLRTVATIPQGLAREVVSRVKVMAEMDIAERRLPQDGRVSLTAAGHKLDLRVSSVPTVHGESVVVRLLDTSNVMLHLSELGLAPETLARFTSCYRRPYGAILVSGPTGSGKSTTLYGALHQLNTGDRKIITIEDPVEYRLDGIQQVPVNPRAGLDFASGLRALLRSDPDVLMIGEIRDRETARIAMEAALTGHLVLATIHTNDAASALTRLTEMGVEPFLSASSVLGVLAQRLARRLCRACRRPEAVPAAALCELAGTSALPPGAGDPECRHTGYRGRVGVFEMLTMSEEVERLTVASRPAAEIRRQARREGMRTLREDGVLKVLAGETTMEELVRTVA
jgi:type IV pilus assembly protein PilB